MRRLVILILIFLSVLSTSSVLIGQDSESDFSILFTTLPITDEGFSPIIEFLEVIKAELSDVNFNVYINKRGTPLNLQLLIHQDEEDEEIYIFLLSIIRYGDDTYVDSKITDISPVLLPRFNVGFSLETSFNVSINSEVDILVPFLLYVHDYWAGDCHAVTSKYDNLDP